MGLKVIAPWIGYKYEEVPPFRLAQSHISFCIRFLLLLLVCVPLFGCCGVKIVESVFLTHKFPCGSYGQTQWWSCNKERMLREMNMDDILHLFDSFECRRTMDLYLVKKTILAVSGSMNTTDRNMSLENIQSTSGPRTENQRYEILFYWYSMPKYQFNGIVICIWNDSYSSPHRRSHPCQNAFVYHLFFSIASPKPIPHRKLNLPNSQMVHVTAMVVVWLTLVPPIRNRGHQFSQMLST